MIKRVYRSKLDIENLSRLRTSIPRDVDKFDYMRRDSHYVGLKDTYFDYI